MAGEPKGPEALTHHAIMKGREVKDAPIVHDAREQALNIRVANELERTLRDDGGRNATEDMSRIETIRDKEASDKPFHKDRDSLKEKVKGNAELETLVDSYSDLSQYLDILRIAKNRGLESEPWKADPEGKLDSVRWQEIKRKSLDLIKSLDYISEQIPGFTLLSVADQDTFLEQWFTQDPEFRTDVNNKLNEVRAGIERLGNLTEGVALVAAKEELVQNKEGTDRIQTEIETLFSDRGLILTSEEIEKVKEGITAGKSGEQIRRELEIEIQRRFSETIQHESNLTREREIDREIREIVIINKDRSLTIHNQPKYDRLKEEQTLLSEAIKNYEDKRRSDPALQKKDDEYQLFKPLIGDSGRIVEPLRRYDELRKQKLAIEARIKVEEKKESASPESLEKTKDRLISEITSGFENVLYRSVADHLIRSYKTYNENLRKEFDRSQTEEDKKFGDSLTSRYIEDRPQERRTIVKRDLIGQDMRVLAWYGDEEGVKRIIVGMLGIEPKVTVHGISRTLTYHETENFQDIINNLTPEQRAQVDRMFNSHKDRIIEKIFVDFFYARNTGLLRRTGRNILNRYEYQGTSGDLRLIPREWKKLGENFKKKIEDGLKKSVEGQHLLKSLEQKGVVRSKFKAMLFMLMSLGAFGLFKGAKEFA